MTTANIPLPSQGVPLPEPDGTFYQGYNKINGYSIGTLIAYGDAREAAALARAPTDSDAVGQAYNLACHGLMYLNEGKTSYGKQCFSDIGDLLGSLRKNESRIPTDDTLAEDEALLLDTVKDWPLHLEALSRILARVHKGQSNG